MEIIILLIAFSVWVLYNRFKAALIQIRREEALRELLKRVRQKHRLDELYGRERRSDRDESRGLDKG